MELQTALIVDIQTYQVLPPFPDEMAKYSQLRQYLSEYGNFKVRSLPHGNRAASPEVNMERMPVTQKELENAILHLFHPHGDRVPQTALLYFTGHALRKNQGIVEEFLATSDVNPAQGSWGISLQWLQAIIQSSPIPQILIWVDYCYGEILDLKFDQLLPNPGGSLSVLAARRGFKLAENAITVDSGSLTPALLDGLNPANHLDSEITSLRLTECVSDYLREYRQNLMYLHLGKPVPLTRKPTPVVAPAAPASSLDCPYPGLVPFQVANAPDFYGRSDVTAQLLQKLYQSHFVALVGNSGRGKSSLLRAGLMANLEAGQGFSGSKSLAIRLFHPGDRPLTHLVWTLCDGNLAASERSRHLNQLQTFLQGGAEGFRQLLQAFFPQGLLLIIDQFEELFTLCQNSREQALFLDCLLGNLPPLDNRLQTAPTANPPFLLAIAMRSDFFSQCLELPDPRLTPYLQRHLVTLTPMDENTLQEIIIEPAKAKNLELPPDLVSEILKDSRSGGVNLPLVQYTLRQLWQQRLEKGLRLATYRQLGGVKNALDQQATAAYYQLSELEQETAQYIFLELIQFQGGFGAVPYARGVINRELVTPRYTLALINLVVKKLVYEQLIVTEPVPLSSGGLEQPVMLYLSHEALIHHWRLLQYWLKERQDSLRQKQDIEDRAKEWQTSTADTQKSYLLSGKALQEVKKFQQEQGDRYPLSQAAEVFIQASSQTERNNRLKFSVLIGIVPVIGLILLGWQLYRYSQTQRHWQVIAENQGKRESLPRIKALEALNQAGVSLSNQQFKHLNLQNINLQKANLSNSNFMESFLTGANLSNADLKTANLSQIDLTSANLTGANLTDAKLTGGYLTGANFSQVNLSNANLGGATLIRITLAGANLNQVDLSQATLIGAKLGEANLTQANLKGANLLGVDLTGANLTKANLAQADLTQATFTEADLSQVILEGANLTNADFFAATNLPLEQVKSACFWEKAIFKDDIQQKLATTTAAKPANCKQWGRKK
ncbi:MAG: pentapeptide repeat-containing protein [Snowella sp.]|nr:pentapeptide repeat-containing protein [Snowella sp.]